MTTTESAGQGGHEVRIPEFDPIEDEFGFILCRDCGGFMEHPNAVCSCSFECSCAPVDRRTGQPVRTLLSEGFISDGGFCCATCAAEDRREQAIAAGLVS